MMVLTEFAANGDLKSYLINSKVSHLEMAKCDRDKLFIRYCLDIAAGMVYLSSQKVLEM